MMHWNTAVHPPSPDTRHGTYPLPPGYHTWDLSPTPSGYQRCNLPLPPDIRSRTYSLPSSQKPDMGPILPPGYQTWDLPPATDIWWSSLELSSIQIYQYINSSWYRHLVLATKTCTVGILWVEQLNFEEINKLFNTFYALL